MHLNLKAAKAFPSIGMCALPICIFATLGLEAAASAPDAPRYYGCVTDSHGNGIAGAVGGESLVATLFASVAGAFMYFATLTEVPILQGLIGSGMGRGPALALLLAGPAVSLPSILVIRSVIGTKKTAAFLALVTVMATMTGLIYGNLMT